MGSRPVPVVLGATALLEELTGTGDVVPVAHQYATTRPSQLPPVLPQRPPHHQQPATTESAAKTMLRWLPSVPWRKVRLAFKGSSCARGHSATFDESVTAVIMKRNHNARLSSLGRHNRFPKKKESPCPVVSFVNQGDGQISVNNGCVMANENELYSMSASTRSINNSSLSSKSTRCLSLAPTPPLRNDSLLDCDTRQPLQWYYGAMTRDACMSLLAGQVEGAFVVRDSTSRPGCYALSLRVPGRVQAAGIAHYLIIKTPQGYFKIKGFSKDFPNIQALITHHSIMPELLPCTLRLAQLQTREAIIEQVPSTTCLPLKSGNNNEQPLLVDVDADPDYQRVLSTFRKSMSNCR